MNKPRRRISLKSLSDERQQLIVCMHEKQFGTIRNLPVIEGEPLLEQARVVRRRNLSKETDRKPVSKNFRLKVAQVRLLETLDEIENGVLELITFRDGLPCELEECSQ